MAKTNFKMIIIAAAVAVTVLIIDLSLPLGVAAGVPYVALTLLGIWFPKPQHTYLLAILGTALTIIGYLASPSGGVLWVVFINRGLALFAIWITALLIAMRKQAEIELRMAHDGLEAQVEKRTKELKKEAVERGRAEHILRKLVEGTYATTGMDFFHNLVQHLAEGLEVDYAFVGELPSDAPGYVRTTAVWAKGEAGEDIEYELVGTPCEGVLENEYCYTEHVQQKFPTDELLVKMNIESYAGIPLISSDGTALGLLVAMHTKPMQNINLVKSMITIFSTRTSAELDRRRTEAQLIQSYKLASLGELTTGIAHELNQPLNITHMAAETLLEMANDGDDLSTEVLTGKLERILDQTDRASAIINNMRTYGHTDSGELEVVDLTAVIQGATGLVKEQLRLSEIELFVDLPETYRKVMGQHLQLEQVVLNLLTNARDATKGHSTDGNKLRRITIEITDDASSEDVRLAIEDTGGGVSDEVLNRIFEPFFTTKEVGQGTGLGLSISYGMIAEMGGRIEVANVNDGARFTIILQAEDETPKRDSL